MFGDEGDSSPQRLFRVSFRLPFQLVHVDGFPLQRVKLSGLLVDLLLQGPLLIHLGCQTSLLAE